MRRVFNYIPTLIVGGIIAYFSFIHNASEYIPRSFLGIEHFDKYLHAFMYMLGAGTFLIDLYRDGRMKKGKGGAICLAIGISSAFGGIIEIMQKLWFSPRTGEWLDWWADTIGAILGVLVALCMIYFYNRIKKK